MSGTTTRERILNTILLRQKCTINDLADAVGINPISVRHHIIKLEVDGLVTAEEERHGVGRPPKYYHLTEAGMEQFPTRYLLLTNRLLDQIKENFSDDQIDFIFTKMGEEVVNRYAGDYSMETLPMEDRLDALKQVMTNEGFTVEWERSGDRYLIHEISCPYYRIGENHPEVCKVDETLISSLLLVPAQRVNCVLNGDAHCTYEIPFLDNGKLEINL
jgi:DeoR family transcriptional regulator, suf operon transcriptional repressor